MTEDRYKVQTWMRRNAANLSPLGDAQTDIAALLTQLGLEEVSQNPTLGTFENVTLSEEDTAKLQARAQRLSDAAEALRSSLRPVPDQQAQALLESALDGYTRAGTLMADGETSHFLEGLATWQAAGDTFEQFAQRLAAAAA